MSIFSAAEDFSRSTLEALPGVWGKLSYIGSLRRAEGGYQHWGLERKYGERAAQTAMQNAHRELVFCVLRMPIRDVVEEVKLAANREDVSVAEYVSRLTADGERLVPVGITGAFASHFRIVLRSLLCLAQDCKDANRQAS